MKLFLKGKWRSGEMRKIFLNILTEQSAKVPEATEQSTQLDKPTKCLYESLRTFLAIDQ